MNLNLQECESNNDAETNTSKDSEVLWKEGRLSIKSATPSVIRRGLCMVRTGGKEYLIWNFYEIYEELSVGENLKNNRDTLKGMNKHIVGIATKASESVIKYGAEVATACDPLAAAIALGGKVGVGVSLSRFSESQCAGLVGVIVSSITPQVKNI
jgi:hypothetical protein